MPRKPANEKPIAERAPRRFRIGESVSRQTAKDLMREGHPIFILNRGVADINGISRYSDREILIGRACVPGRCMVATLPEDRNWDIFEHHHVDSFSRYYSAVPLGRGERFRAPVIPSEGFALNLKEQLKSLIYYPPSGMNHGWCGGGKIKVMRVLDAFVDLLQARTKEVL